jgi:uncharacterized protein involved in exopolysaccharide biosynthesis
MALGTRVFESTTILLYRPSEASADTPTLLTLQSMVKLPATLERAREQAKIGASLGQVGASVQADVQRSTDLLSIRCQWDSPETAHKLVNAVKDAFLETQVERRLSKLQARKSELEKRLNEVSAGLAKAEKALQNFTVTNKVIDLDKEAQWYLEEVTNLQLLLEQAQVKRTSVNMQSGSLDRITSDLRAKVAEEAAKGNTNVENIGDINIKVQRLRAAISDDKEQRSGQALLDEKKLELDRAIRLKEKGLVSQAEYEKTLAAYESQKALTVETPDIQRMKGQIDDLNAKVIPKEAKAGESAPILQQMMLKDFEIELLRVSQDQEVQQLKEARDRAKARLDGLPELQQRFAALSRDVEALELEKTTLEKDFTSVKTSLSSNLADFVVVSEAVVPKDPVSSNRRMVALAVALMVAGLGTLTVLTWTAADTRLYSVPDLKARLGVVGLAGLAAGKPEDQRSFDFLALEVRRSLPGPATLLLLSQNPKEGKSVVLQGLAAALQRQGARVAILIANADVPQQSSLRDALGKKEPQGAGWASALESTDCARPELAKLLTELRERFDYLLIEAPEAKERVEVDLLLEKCDACLVVVAAGRDSTGTLLGLLARLKKSDKRILGAVLNKVAGPYQRFNP